MSVFMGIDWGRRRVGIAWSDELGLMAHPAETILPRSLDDLADRVAARFDARRAEAVVLGLPLRADGSDGDSARTVRELARRLEARGMAVHLRDERFTSVEAATRLKGTGRRARVRTGLDSAAAALLLQSYLDQRRGGVV